VTAEGVETVSEHALLADEKCGHFQGYLCSPARPVSELGRFLGPVLDDLRVAS
jgi:EAL domain-containing protein (putative c-di-GMP-specific phosphodiesterase class I)